MSRYSTVGVIVLIVILASCKKDSENKPTSDALEGTYTFKYITSKQDGSTATSFGAKAVTAVEWTSINNGGTIQFSNSTTSGSGLTYEVDAEGKYYIYDGTDLLDSLDLPIVYTLPPSNATGTYQLIGADSIYFPQGSIASSVPASGSTPVVANGGRYAWNGKLLTITQTYSKDSTYMDSGETIHILQSAVTKLVLEKQ